MKQVFTAMLCLFCTVIIAKNAPVKLSDGVYSSNFGDVHMITSKSGKKTVGLYGGKGHLLLSKFSITGRATMLTGSFNNKKSLGKVGLAITNNKWDGDWKWNNTAGKQWEGSWDGNLKTTSKLRGLHLWNTFVTDAGTLELIHNPDGKVGGFLYTDGKEYYVYGGFWGASQMKFQGYISSSEDDIKTSGNFDIDLDWSEGFYGTIKVPGKSAKTVRGAVNRQQLKFTLQTIKNYENRGLMHGEEKGKVKLTTAVFDEKGRTHVNTWYNDGSNKTYKEGKEYNVDKVNIIYPYYTLTNSGYYHNPKMNINFTHNRQRTISNAQDRLVAHSVPLKPIIEYLKFKRNASSFANAADGRKSIPGSDHTFWLSETNGKRTARGYAFIKYGDDDKWGYFYTITLY